MGPIISADPWVAPEGRRKGGEWAEFKQDASDDGPGFSEIP